MNASSGTLWRFIQGAWLLPQQHSAECQDVSRREGLQGQTHRRHGKGEETDRKAAHRVWPAHAPHRCLAGSRRP